MIDMGKRKGRSGPSTKGQLHLLIHEFFIHDIMICIVNIGNNGTDTSGVRGSGTEMYVSSLSRCCLRMPNNILDSFATFFCGFKAKTLVGVLKDGATLLLVPRRYHRFCFSRKDSASYRADVLSPIIWSTLIS